MRLKKILLFILIFFFCLVVKNNVNAYVVNEGGQGKYYLQDLPFDDSGETSTSVFFYNSSNNIVVCVEVPNYKTLGYDRISNLLCIYDNTDFSKSTIFYYKCSVSLQDGMLVGEKWSSLSASGLNMSKYIYIGGTGKLYPAHLANYPITTLPEGVSWGDDFLMYYHSGYECVALYYPVQSKSGIFVEYYRYYKILFIYR